MDVEGLYNDNDTMTVGCSEKGKVSQHKRPYCIFVLRLVQRKLKALLFKNRIIKVINKHSTNVYWKAPNSCFLYRKTKPDLGLNMC